MTEAIVYHAKQIVNTTLSTEAEMLVLRRKLNENVMIGDDIEIRVVAIGPKWVRLGITAPIDVPVHREEVYHAIHEGDDPHTQDA